MCCKNEDIREGLTNSGKQHFIAAAYRMPFSSTPEDWFDSIIEALDECNECNEEDVDEIFWAHLGLPVPG